MVGAVIAKHVPDITSAKDRRARKLLAKKVGVVKIAILLGVGTGTIQRIKAETAAASA